MIPQDWTKDEFLAFMMIYAAYSDCEIVQSEKDFIVNMVGEETFHNLLELFLQSTDAGNLSLIVDMKDDYIKTESDKAELFDTLYQVITADEVVNNAENEMFSNFKFLFDY